MNTAHMTYKQFISSLVMLGFKHNKNNKTFKSKTLFISVYSTPEKAIYISSNRSEVFTSYAKAFNYVTKYSE